MHHSMKQQGIAAAMAGHARHKLVPAHLEILQPMSGSVNLVSEYLTAGLQASYEPYETVIKKKKRQRKVLHSIARPTLTLTPSAVASQPALIAAGAG